MAAAVREHLHPGDVLPVRYVAAPLAPPAGPDSQAFCYDEQNRLTWAQANKETRPVRDRRNAGHPVIGAVPAGIWIRHPWVASLASGLSLAVGPTPTEISGIPTR